MHDEPDLTAPTRLERPAADTVPEARRGGREPQLAPGATVARFLITGIVGEGAMGVVYEAYDPRLDRRIALKLLRKPRSEDATVNRFLREAQALARVSHPNVVQVHDVGSEGDTSFIAMELIEGRTLDQWLADKPRARAEILAVLIGAGQGLAAAHRAGIIHRDFKPSNVIVGLDGRARVLDFGVARGIERPMSDPPGSGPTPVPGRADLAAAAGFAAAAPSLTKLEALAEGDEAPVTGASDSGDAGLSAPLTTAGVIIGTLAFMAPEQLRGETVDERCDQFAFCVTAHLALHGRRPFIGRQREALLENIARGPVPPPRGGPRVPRHVRQTLARGLAFRAEERYPTIEALLADLARDPAARWRRVGLAAAVLAVGAGIALVAFRAPAPREPPCASAARALDEVWNPARRAALEQTFGKSARPGARDAFTHTAAALDGYAGDWRRMRVAACEATHVEHTQSPLLLDKRMACLDRRLGALHALVELLGQPGGDTVDRAVDAALRLPTVAPCTDATALGAMMPMPTDPPTLYAVVEVGDTLAAAKALALAGRFEDARALLEPALPVMRELGYLPLVAEALYELSGMHDDLGHGERSEALLYEALEAAAQAGHVALEADLWAALAWAVGYRQQRFADVLIIERAARVALARAGDPPLPRASLLAALGVSHIYQGEVKRGLEELREALVLRERVLGEDNVLIAHSLDALGVACEFNDLLDEALQHAERAMRIRERLYGPNHPELAFSLINLAEGHSKRGEPAVAEPLVRRALALREATLGPDHLDTGWALYFLAGLLKDLKRYDEALALFDRAAVVLAKEIGEGQLPGGMFRHRLGRLHLDKGEPARALPLLRQATADFEKGGGPDHPGVAAALLGVGQAELASGDGARAVRTLERALALGEKVKLSPRELAEHHLRLADALWSQPAERARALEHGARARELAQTGTDDPAGRALRAEIDAWRQQHPTAR